MATAEKTSQRFQRFPSLRSDLARTISIQGWKAVSMPKETGLGTYHCLTLPRYRLYPMAIRHGQWTFTMKVDGLQGLLVNNWDFRSE